MRPRRASSAPAATRAGVSRSRASLVRHSDRRCSAPHDASAPGDGCCGGPAWSRRCGGVDIPGLASDQQLPELGRLREHVAAEDHQGDQRHFDKTPALLEAAYNDPPLNGRSPAPAPQVTPFRSTPSPCTGIPPRSRGFCTRLERDAANWINVSATLEALAQALATEVGRAATAGRAQLRPPPRRLISSPRSTGPWFCRVSALR